MKYLVMFLIVFAIALVVNMVSYIRDNEKLRYEIENLRVHLETQNAAIRQNALDSSEYHKNAELREAQANERYKLLNGVSSNCEARMQEAQRILGEFKAFLDKQKGGY